MSNTDLLGDPLPEPLPTNSRLTSVEQLIGHEIRGTYMATTGIWGYAGLVLVTATGCWITFDTEDDGDEHYIGVTTEYSGKAVELVGYVPAETLFLDECISGAEFARFEAMEKEHAIVEKERKANRLRRELAALEGDAA